MGSLKLDASKVSSYVLPKIIDSKNEINYAYQLCNKIEGCLPNSFTYRSTLSDMSGNLYYFERRLNILRDNLEKKISNLNKIESKSESKANKLTSQISQFNLLLTKSISNALISKNNLNVKSSTKVSVKKENTGAKISKKINSIFKKFTSGIKDVAAKISNSFKALFKKAEQGINEIPNFLTKFKNETSKLLTTTSAIISPTFSTILKNKEILDKVEVTVASNSAEKEFNYKDLFNTSFDDKKLFGKDTTLGLNGERIVFDKMYKFDDGSVVYKKDDKTVKEIGNGYVKIGYTTYYEDGSYSVEREETGEWNNISDYYTADGKIVKTISKGMGETSTQYYNENGVVVKKESFYSGNTVVTTYDPSGNELEITKNGILYIQFKDNKTIYCDSKGNIESEVEKLADKTITYNKKNNTKQITYTNGVIENYDENNRLKTSKDKNGIETEYRYLKNGEKIGYIEKNENGQAVLTCYDKNGNIKSQTIGKCIGGVTGSDGETNIPMLDGKTSNYNNGVVVSTFDKSEGVTVGEGYQEYSSFGSKYGHYQSRIEALGLKYHFCQGVNTVRENYDANGNLKNVTCTGFCNVNDGGKVYVTQVYYPGGKWSKTEKRYDANGNFVNETYYLWDANGNILESH